MLIDGVFSGGGMKGFALVGAYQALEEKGYRFDRVAGTSAGAIIASFIVAGYTADEIEKLLDELDPVTLLDPRRNILPVPFMKWLRLYWKMGLYQGKALEDWLFEKLSNKGIYSFGDVPKGSLKLIASDLTNGKMIVLPNDLENYGINSESFPLAKAVRMSAGIPFFFEPIQLKTNTNEMIVVDGGVLSNFPMWLFQNQSPGRRRPLIGLKLSTDMNENGGYKISNALQMFEALFSTMKDAHDNHYISRKYEKDVVFIPVDGFKATQFDLSEEQKKELMTIGRNRTLQFLKFW